MYRPVILLCSLPAVIFQLITWLPPPAKANSFSSPDSTSPSASLPAKRVHLPRHEGQPVFVDGRLDEDVWADAARFGGFYQYLPVDGKAISDSTVVYAWYSPTAIYFGIQAYDTNGEVRANLADRDKIVNDDYVYLVLDTYNDSRQAFIFGANPLGQQADGILRDAQPRNFSSSSTGSYTVDLSPDFVYTSKGVLTDYGYQLEIEIPFKSLRYQSDYVQDWGFNVIRKIQHSGYTSTWTQVMQGNASFMAQNGTLQALENLRRGLVLDINPEVTGTVSRDASPASWQRDVRDPLGMNVRWGISNNLTLNATVNPDFSQVEADVAQIQFDPREAVFISEKRPFFLDGIELFQSPTQLIYTRRISNPLSAAKLTGKAGKTNIALLSAIDNDEVYLADLEAVYFNAVRLRQDLSGQNTVGLTYTDKNDPSHWNRVAAVDGRLVFSRIYSLTYQTGMSFTRDAGGDMISAPMWTFSAAASGRKYGATFSSTGFHGNFNAESGFITRVGVAQMTFRPRVTWFGDEGEFVESFSTGFTLDGRWDYDRFTRGTGPNDRKLHGNTSYQLRGGWSGGTSVFYESFKYPENLYTDYFIERRTNGVPVDTVAYTGTDRLTNLGFWTTLNTPQLNTFSGRLFFVAGRDDNFFEWAPADIYFLTLTLNWNPTNQLRFNFLYNHQHYVRAGDKSTVGIRRVPRLKVEYQVTPALFLRLVGQYDSNFVDALRDDSRTDDPILILDRDTGIYSRTSRERSNRFRVDWLFSYRPSPGTVLFFGYGNSSREPHSFRFNRLERINDGFFIKLSYLFRV